MNIFENVKKTIADKEKINRDVKTIFIVVVLGFIIHGTYAFDKTIWFDDATSIGGWAPWAAIQHGRWMWGAIDYVMKFFVGTELIASWHILNALIVIGIISIILLNAFSIENKYTRGLLILYMLVNVTVLGNFGYVGSSAMNFVGILLATLAAIYVYNGVYNIKYGDVAGGIILLILSLGMYQCYLAYFITLILLLFIDSIFNHSEKKIVEYFKTGILIIIAVIISLIVYFAITSLVCSITGYSLTEYAGTSTYGVVDAKTYINRIVFAYKEFFVQPVDKLYSVFPFQWRGWWIILLIVLFIEMALVLVTTIRKKEYKKCFTGFVLFAILPLAHNLVFVMYDIYYIHSLHMYQSILIFYFMVMMFRYIEIDNSLLKVFKVSVYCMLVIFDLLLVKYDNQCYVSIKLAREQSTSFLNQLISDIHSTEGYVDGMQVFVVNLNELAQKGMDSSKFLEGITTNPYYTSTFDYTVNDFITLYTGEKIEIRELYEGDYDYVGLASMPKYPSYGSIKVMDDRVIVNL